MKKILLLRIGIAKTTRQAILVIFFLFSCWILIVIAFNLKNAFVNFAKVSSAKRNSSVICNAKYLGIEHGNMVQFTVLDCGGNSDTKIKPFRIEVLSPSNLIIDLRHTLHIHEIVSIELDITKAAEPGGSNSSYGKIGMLNTEVKSSELQRIFNLHGDDSSTQVVLKSIEVK